MCSREHRIYLFSQVRPLLCADAAALSQDISVTCCLSPSHSSENELRIKLEWPPETWRCFYQFQHLNCVLTSDMAFHQHLLFYSFHNYSFLKNAAVSKHPFYDVGFKLWGLVVGYSVNSVASVTHLHESVCVFCIVFVGTRRPWLLKSRNHCSNTNLSQFALYPFNIWAAHRRFHRRCAWLTSKEARSVFVFPGTTFVLTSSVLYIGVNSRLLMATFWSFQIVNGRT